MLVSGFCRLLKPNACGGPSRWKVAVPQLGQSQIFCQKHLVLGDHRSFSCNKFSLSVRRPIFQQGRRAPFSTGPKSPFNTQVGALGGNFRVSTVFTTLLVFGVGATALGLYQFYTSFTLWPEELRGDLRAGIKAKNQGDFGLSERYLTRAYRTASSMSPSALSPSPYLKLSGIAAILAEVTPERKARVVLEDTWKKAVGHELSASSVPADDWESYSLSDEERLRRVGIACKLAELSSEQTEEEEKWLVWAVEEVLRLVGLGVKNWSAESNSQVTKESTQAHPILSELELPPWIRKDDLGAPLAALGNLYAKKGNIEYAIPLYLQAISLLLPKNAKNVGIEDRCEAAQIMNNLSELIMRRPPTPEIRHQAEAWARQALSVIERAEKEPLPRKGWFTSAGNIGVRETCDQVLGVVLFNIGMLREMDSDKDAAYALFEKSARQCAKVGMEEGIRQAKTAMRRVGQSGETKAS